MKAYLDNGATTATAKEVVKAMLPYFTKDYGNASSIHSMGLTAKKALDDARKKFAEYINASPEEIIFTSGGTESDNIAIQGTVNVYKNEKIHVITSKIEHPAVLNVCKNLDVEVTYIDVNSEGIINLDQLKKTIKPNTKLITIMHANNEIGTIQPIKEIGEIAKKHNITFHTDAVQSFTKVKIDVKEINADLVSFSAHKVHGPKGVGALYIKKGTPLSQIYQGGAHEFKRRAGTENIPGIVGFAKALELCKDSDNERMAVLRDKLIDGLLKIPDSKLNGSRNRLCNNANIGFDFIEGEGLMMHLNQKGIFASTGSACSSKSLEPSHVLAALYPREDVHGASIRFTLSRYTTEKEIDYTIKTVGYFVNKLRKFTPLRKGAKFEGDDHV